MWHLTACKISVNLSFLNRIKNEMIFYRISELMLATLIQRYDKKNLISFQGTLANKADPDQMLQNAASDQGLHCLN